jgi:uroporphyrinogen-III synthase
MRESGWQPLRGWRVAVTRPAHGAAELSELLRARGAEAVALPLLRIAPPEDATPLLSAARRIADYDWIVFTSASAVRALHDALRDEGRLVRRPPGRIAVVGPATAAAVAELLSWSVAAVPDEYVADAVSAAMAAAAPLRGARVLWPRARDARDVLPGELRAAGAILDDPEAYRTVEDLENARVLSAMLMHGQLDAVTLTSPSAVRCLAAARPRLGGAILAVIGPVTAQAARASGLPVHVEPDQHTIPELVSALAAYVAERGLSGGARRQDNQGFE